MGVVGRYPGLTAEEQQTPDGLGHALWSEGHVIGVITTTVVADVVSDIRLMMNPAKLTLWGRPSRPGGRSG